jgi:hypothetical protein
MPSALATAGPSSRLSPVSITTRTPSSCRPEASAVDALMGSATPRSPASLAVDRDEHHGLALAAQRLRPGRQRAEVDPSSDQRRVAQRDGRSVHRPAHPLAGHRREVDGRPPAPARFRASRTGARWRGQRVLAAALEAGRQAQQLGLVEPAAPR